MQGAGFRFWRLILKPHPLKVLFKRAKQLEGASKRAYTAADGASGAEEPCDGGCVELNGTRGKAGLCKAILVCRLFNLNRQPSTLNPQTGSL